MGVDCLTGGAFSCHPIEWLHRGLISNPNLLITGVPGSGKSATIKALSLRLMAYGIPTFVLGDIKNEYSPLARALGVEPVELGPGLKNRLNPLDAGPLGKRLSSDRTVRADQLGEIHRRRIALLASLLEIRLKRRITPSEEAALSHTIKHASGEADGNSTLKDPTIPEVWGLLRDPAPDLVSEMRMDSIAELRETIRPAVDALGNMIQGTLAGLFDGPTTVALDFDAPIQTVDLSRMRGRGQETTGMLYSCTGSWGQAAIDDPNDPLRVVVRDELWEYMRIAAMLRKVDSDLRLSRTNGRIEILSTHKLSDFESVGPAGGEAVTIAKGLISNCDVRICLAQDTEPLAMTRDVIGLTDTECQHIASWTGQHKGRAIWKVGRSSSHVVQTMLTPIEQELTWTNERMSL
ncbi:type VI secretion protein [Glycomyces dulcitolivorans]|uniref:type VI secretion protein n=1 Tax=Glycomyces dulcitolivorans TaxID=2200759 RepID=UPI001E592BF8|nr:type VI secretion protein [Glycomyces dulcitolivorans]